MLARFAPALFVCLWATGFIGARMGMPYAEPGTFLSIRFVIAFSLLAVIATVFRAPWPGARNALSAILIGALMHGFYLGGVFWAINQGMPAGVSAVVVGLQPLLTAIIAGWWLKETITRGHWLGLALGLLGVAIVLYPKLDISNSGITPFTIGASLLAVSSISMGTILQKRLGATQDIRSGTALQYLGGFIPVFILSITSETRVIEWSGEAIFAMAWLVIVLSFLATFLLMWLIQHGSVAKVSSLFFLVPAVSSLMAYFLFDERLIPLQLFGMALCAVAVALATRKQPTPTK